MDNKRKSVSPDEAEKLDVLTKQLKEKFKRAKKNNDDIARERSTQYNPITNVLETMLEHQQRQNTPIVQAIESLENKLVPLTQQQQPAIDYDSAREDDVASDNGVEVDLNQTLIDPLRVYTPTAKLHSIDESFLYGTPTSSTGTPIQTYLGKEASKFLPRAKDKVFGLYFNNRAKSYMIGNKKVKFAYEDIYVDDEKYQGTPGLWRLLTYVEPPDSVMYTSNDYENYKKILISTDSLYHGNNRESNKPKSSKGTKWINLCRDIWKEIQGTDSNTIGSGILEYNDNNVEYKYVDNLNKLISRMHYIYSQEQAGNNNFHNEKIGILKFFNNQLEDVIDSPKGTEYLMKFISNVPSKFMKDEKLGSGLFNTILKKIPFEVHAPGYNYLGPGTDLDNRLARGDKPINKLDEAAREHDLFYRDHEKTADRHVADKILQDKALERVKSSDADRAEKFWSLATATGMLVKRKLGMGIQPQLKFSIMN